MKEDIDNEEEIFKIFKQLVDEYIGDYNPPKKDQELKSEFDNQKANMIKNAEDLSKRIKETKLKHIQEIEDNRKENTKLIENIDAQKKIIKEKKAEKSKKAADERHENAIAAIEAQNKLKYLEELEFDSQEEKVEFLEKLLQESRDKLAEKKEELRRSKELQDI